MAAPGARVSITHVAHIPSLRNNHAPISQTNRPSPPTPNTAPSPSPLFTPMSSTPPSLFPPTHSLEGHRPTWRQPANAVIRSSAVSLEVTGPIGNLIPNPPPPGYHRKFMMVRCHLHNRETTPEQVVISDGVMNPFENAGSGQSHGQFQGYCSICRRVVRVDSRGGNSL